jgi:DNA-binding beta-propeller fold protein YncE
MVDPENRFLYVLHNGLVLNAFTPITASHVTIHEIDSQKPVATIPLGYGAQMRLSGDRRYVLGFARGVPQTKRQAQHNAVLTVIDVSTHKDIADLTLSRLGGAVVVNKDLSRMFVLTPAELPTKKSPGSKAYLTVFNVNNESPLAEMQFEGFPQSMTLSRDGKYLYLFDPGTRPRRKNVSGILYVVDVESAKMVKSHDVGANPRMLQVDPESDLVTLLGNTGPKDPAGSLYEFRGSELVGSFPVGTRPQFLAHVGRLPSRLLITYDQLHFVDRNGSLTAQTIPVNAKGGGESVVRLGGYPGEILHLPEVNKLVMSVRQGGSLGAPTSKVAFVDLKENKVERVVTTGRGSVKFGKVVGAMAASVAMSSLSYYGGYYSARAAGSPFFYYNMYWFSPGRTNVELTTSPDGRFVYALNTFSNDVTIIKSEDGTVLDHVPVGRGEGRVFRAPGDRFICAYTSKKVTLIDPSTNKVQLEHNVQGILSQFLTDDQNQRLLVLSNESLHAFSAEKGELIGSIDGLKNARSMIFPMAPELGERTAPEAEE